MDFFSLILLALIATTAACIAYAVRRTRAEIGDPLRGTDPGRRTDFAVKLAQDRRTKADSVRCPECDGPTFILVGTNHRYECQVCHEDFDGPEHLPALAGISESGHPTGG